MTVTSSILSVSNDNTVNAIIAASASITSNSITVLDKFLGDDIVKGICSKIRKSDVGTDSVINVNTLNELILRGNCIRLVHASCVDMHRPISFTAVLPNPLTLYQNIYLQ